MAYVVLLALAALDAAGYSLIAPVVPEIAAKTGAGPGVMGALVASFAIGQMIGYPIAGRAIHRRQAVVVLAVSLALILVGDTGFIAAGGLGVYFPARLLQGIGAGGLWIGTAFAVLERYPGEEYRRLTGLAAIYGIGAIAGPAIGGAGGIKTPFALHFALVSAAGLALLLLGAPRNPAQFTSDRGALRTRGFWVASAGILLVALTLGTFDGPLPLHFAEQLSQARIGALYVVAALVEAVCVAAAGSLPPRPVLWVGAALMPASIALAGLSESVPVWVAVAALAGIGIGAGEAGSLGVLLEAIGVEKIVLAMVIWSQVWAVGYLAGPAAGGGVAEALGFGAIGLVPLAASLLLAVAYVPVRRESAVA